MTIGFLTKKIIFKIGAFSVFYKKKLKMLRFKTLENTLANTVAMILTALLKILDNHSKQHQDVHWPEQKHQNQDDRPHGC